MELFGLYFDGSVRGEPFTHDRSLVLLSFVVAVIASYTALELAERLRSAEKRGRTVWHAASAVVFGGGVWAMHFIAMLGFQTPLERGYHLGLTIFSAAISMSFAALGFVFIREQPSMRRLMATGTIAGLGILATNYVGLAALRVAGEVVYQPTLFILSTFIALSAAPAALWLAKSVTEWWERAGAALLMALAMCGVHYAAIGAMTIVAGPEVSNDGVTISESNLAIIVVISALVLVAVGLGGAFYDRQRQRDAIGEAAILRDQVARRTADLEVAARELDDARRRAEAASAAKSDFLANMSHELRTPLNSILGFSHLLRNGDGFDPLSENQDDAIGQIEQAGRHLLLLIDEILDLSSIEAGKVALAITKVDVAALAQEVTSMLQPTAVDASITLHSAASDRAAWVRADRRRLQQILINLVANAIKYNKPGGTIKIQYHYEPDSIGISVTDTGVGIAAQHLHELFEPFNRLGQAQSGTVGNGVGLALCKRLVEAMSGSIEVTSREGEGSTFTVFLPTAQIDSPALPDAAALARTTILYVEDNPSNVLLLRHAIKHLEDVELVVAVSGQEGLDMARALQPAVILLDINLPDIDGFEVLRQLKEDRATMLIPAFALTASAMPREVERGLAAGFDRYLTKPIDVPQMVAAITEITGPARGVRNMETFFALTRTRRDQVEQVEHADA